MFDFLVKNASLPDGRENIDIAGKNGFITNVEKNISAEAKETIEDEGMVDDTTSVVCIVVETVLGLAVIDLSLL